MENYGRKWSRFTPSCQVINQLILTAKKKNIVKNELPQLTIKPRFPLRYCYFLMNISSYVHIGLYIHQLTNKKYFSLLCIIFWRFIHYNDALYLYAVNNAKFIKDTRLKCGSKDAVFVYTTFGRSYQILNWEKLLKPIIPKS